MPVLNEVRPGQTWRWQEPNGGYREMLIQRIQDGPGARRAVGYHPQTGKRLQVYASTLAKGLRGAELMSVIENFEWSPVRPRW